MESKSRKWLRHDIPTWVDSKDEVFFITVCCEERGANVLANNKTAKGLLESVRFRESKRIWRIQLFLVMTDHIHAILKLGVESKGLPLEIKNWKSWTAKKLGVSWQDGFFDHRLRNAESLSQKYDYIIQNPVRAGLVEKPTQWKWKIESED